MFADLFQSRRPVPAYEHAFVESVAVRPAEPPDPRVERIILVCWLVIALKHIAVIWAVYHYHVPFHPLWVNGPTWLFATGATLLYYRRW